jgi:hypothetical protein
MEHTKKIPFWLVRKQLSDNVHEHLSFISQYCFFCGAVLQCLVYLELIVIVFFWVDKSQEQNKGFCVHSSHCPGYNAKQLISMDQNPPAFFTI